jgi:hypothetical protein
LSTASIAVAPAAAETQSIQVAFPAFQASQLPDCTGCKDVLGFKPGQSCRHLTAPAGFSAGNERLGTFSAQTNGFKASTPEYMEAFTFSKVDQSSNDTILFECTPPGSNELNWSLTRTITFGEATAPPAQAFGKQLSDKYGNASRVDTTSRYEITFATATDGATLVEDTPPINISSKAAASKLAGQYRNVLKIILEVCSGNRKKICRATLTSTDLALAKQLVEFEKSVENLVEETSKVQSEQNLKDSVDYLPKL